jgi:putative phosphoesterase
MRSINSCPYCVSRKYAVFVGLDAERMASMKLGILSDTHDNKDNLKSVLEIYRAQDIHRVFHLGDMTSPATAQLLGGFELLYLTGHMDRDPVGLRATILSLHPENQIVESFTGDVEGISMAAVHGHREPSVEELAQSGKYQFVLCGHTHRRRDEVMGETRIINPGALGGVEWESRSYCMFDLTTREIAFHQLS